METKTKNNLYEGMFLVDSAAAASNWDGVNNAIKTILERAEAEIVSIRKWDDRKLAYEIHRVGRGVYILCYFRANGERIREIEKAVQLSEQIMRVLILNAEHMTTKDIEKETPATKAEMEKHKGVEESDKDEQAERQSSDDEAGDAEKSEKAQEAEQAEEAEQAKEAEQDSEETTEDEQESKPYEISND